MESVELKKQAPDDREGQAAFDRRGVPLSSEMTALMQQMRAEDKTEPPAILSARSDC